jgi:hypothetical protein
MLIVSNILGKLKAVINICIYSFVVSSFVVMQCYVEWIKFQQKKSQSVTHVAPGNELVLQKSGK